LACLAKSEPAFTLLENNRWWLEPFTKSKKKLEIYLAVNGETIKYWKKSAIKTDEALAWLEKLKAQDSHISELNSQGQVLSREIAENKKSNAPLESLLQKKNTLTALCKELSKEVEQTKALVDKIVQSLEDRCKGDTGTVHSDLGPQAFNKEDVLNSLLESGASLSQVADSCAKALR